MVLDDLSPTQRRVARMVAECATNKQIAATLGTSETAIAQHVGRIASRWKLDRSKNIRVQVARAYLDLPSVAA